MDNRYTEQPTQENTSKAVAISIDAQTNVQITPCLENGPISETAGAFVSATLELGNNAMASCIRAWCVPYLFQDLEVMLAEERDPVKGINSSLRMLTEFVCMVRTTGLEAISGSEETTGDTNIPTEVKDITGDHYGNLFKSFSTRSYWDEPVKLLKQRLERNGIEIGDIEGKKTLDAGCGGGRYAVAWRLLGASPVTGLDISPINIRDANRRIKESEIEDIHFEEGNVLELPFENDEFDVVFSNGVLHHTTDWKAGVRELVRVMNPGGLGWLYLIENPGGIFWDMIEILRLVMKDEEKSRARDALRLLNIPANRIFYMLDHVMVPVNLRLTSEEIEDCLSAAGAKDIRRLDRGSDFDRVEHIYRGSKYAKEFFGAGENRHIFSK